MRIFFSVGEPSGDLHASNLIRRLRQHGSHIECVGFGGPKMRDAGCDLLFELTQMAIMFVGKALANLRFFFRLIAQADDYFARNEVDAVVLIDYSGFNWWIARKAKKHQIPVFYYGVPQVWAWAPWRIRKIRKYVDHVLCKLPFEKTWFEQRNCKATYVGHPYFDQLVGQQLDESFLSTLCGDSRPLLTLLPGSRDQEIENNLPVLIESAAKVAQSVPHVRIAVASYNSRQCDRAAQMVDESGKSNLGIELYSGKTQELMTGAAVCLACSGSVSLELLYHRKPTVIIYRIKRWAMMAQSVLIRVRYITLVNLIAAKDIRKSGWFRATPSSPDGDQPPMPEHLTSGDPSAQVAAQAIEWLTNESSRQANIRRLDQLAREYAFPGASEKAADYILEHLGYPIGQAAPKETVFLANWADSA